MPFNVLLLPLLGGYIFLSSWNVTRFDTKRYSGERLLFHSAAAGIVFLILAFVITRGLIAAWPALYGWWRAMVPFPYTGTSLLAFLMGSLGWAPLNLFADRDKHAAKAVEEWGDFLELLLNECMTTTRQVSLTLSSGKAYIGFVTSSFDPSFDRKYMKIMPTLSGYRDPKTKELVITNDYADVYQRMIEDEDAALFQLADEFQLVIPVAEIVSANLFDPQVYEIFRGADVDLIGDPEAQQQERNG